MTSLPTSPHRSALMKRVRRQDTAPEILVRRALHAAGLRYRLHVRGLPGSPDLVLPRRGTVVFVHGCFWHGHDCRHGSAQSKSNTAFWQAKIEANRERDSRQRLALEVMGWQVETVWECECKEPQHLERLVVSLLER
jgi:DNA mismatch endonuclease (patch repair protein)